MSTAAKIASFDDLVEGQAVPVLERNVDPVMLIKYAGAADDYSPMHWDVAFARERGFDNIIAHGWLTCALMCETVTDWIPLEIADIRSYTIRYQKIQPLGIATCGGQVKAKRREGDRALVDLELWAKDQAGAVTTSASMTLELV